MQASTKSSKVESLYKRKLYEEFNQISSVKKKSNIQISRGSELKQLLEVIDSFQWGESKLLTKISQDISKKLNHRIESVEVTTAFKELMKRELLIGVNEKVLSIPHMAQKIEVYIYLKSLYYSTSFQKSRTKIWRISKLNLKKTLFLYARKIKQEEMSSDLSAVLKSSQVNLPSTQDTFIIKGLISRQGLSVAVITKEIKDIIEYFKVLEPLPALRGKKDKQGAFKILDISPESTEAQIKKQYKRLAKLKHPDRLRAKGIPSEFEKIANENFTQIQQAYDILVG